MAACARAWRCASKAAARAPAWCRGRAPGTGVRVRARPKPLWRPARRGGCRYLGQLAAPHVVDVAVNRNVAGHQGMVADALHVLEHALLLVGDGEPTDVLAFG